MRSVGIGLCLPQPRRMRPPAPTHFGRSPRDEATHDQSRFAAARTPIVRNRGWAAWSAPGFGPVMTIATADERGANPSVGKLLAVLGVVYGDIGTSPLYALREAVTLAKQQGASRSA